MIRHASLCHTNHRPYPLVTRRPWAIAMQWHDLLFMHWPIDPAQMREIVPPALELDLFEGQAWLGVVPFRMTGIRPRCLPALPGWVGQPNPSRFNELNVRTYVRVDGRPGVVFFSLDAESRLAVRAARRFFHLPYYDADMECRPTAAGWIRYASRRTHIGAAPATLHMQYRALPDSRPRPGEPGSLEHFLTERYCLYAVDPAGAALRGEIHHRPWPLQPAEVEIDELDMTPGFGMDLTGQPPLAHFAKRIEVVAWTNVPATASLAR